MNKRDPADWVEALDAAFFRDGRIDTYVTLCTGYLDLRAGIMRLVTAGHPPPVVLGRTARRLDVPPAPPLGLGFADVWTATELPWVGDPVLFYTDGLIENPMSQGSPRRWGEDGLLTWLGQQSSTSSVEALARALFDKAITGRDLRDDVAVLLVGASL